MGKVLVGTVRLEGLFKMISSPSSSSDSVPGLDRGDDGANTGALETIDQGPDVVTHCRLPPSSPRDLASCLAPDAWFAQEGPPLPCPQGVFD